MTPGSEASSSSRGASARRRVAQRERRAGDLHRADGIHALMQLCLYDVHGNLPALETVLADAGSRRSLRARRRLHAVRRLAGRDHRAAARARAGRVDPRQLRTAGGGPGRGAARPSRARGRARGARRRAGGGARGAAAFDRGRRHGHLPRVAARRLALVPARAGRRRARAAGRRDGPAARCSATRTCPSAATPTAIELVNPGSVGLPFDGDPRAGYALLHDDGRVEHRRVEYDVAASAAKVRSLGPWGDDIAGALRAGRRWGCD